MAIRDDFEVVAGQVRAAVQRFALGLLVIAAFGAMLIGKADTILVENARAQRPDALIVIDYSGFNLRLARAMRQLGVPVVYYISPQIWAWRAGRLKTIKELVERVLVIFPFESKIYQDAGVPVEFVGHPLIDLVPHMAPRAAFLHQHGLDGSARTIAVLPGSRSSHPTFGTRSKNW